MKGTIWKELYLRKVVHNNYLHSQIDPQAETN